MLTAMKTTANFAQHAQGQCAFCDQHCPELCAAYQMFAYAGTEDAWKRLRGFIVPSSNGKTVWQLLLKAERIADYRGGRFADGADVPTPEQVTFALLTGASV